MFKSTCKKVESLLGLYIENKLPKEEINFVREHLDACSSCYNKYLTMKRVIKNLRFEYEKLLNEFEKIEAERIFSIREYDNFMVNISPYLDDELSDDEAIKFRTYLLKSKKAREQLTLALKLKNNIQNSFAEIGSEKQLNYQKLILKKLKQESNKKPSFYGKAAIIIGLMLPCLLFLSVYFSYSYLENMRADENSSDINMSINNLESQDLEEYSFDVIDKTLLTGKN